MILIAMAWRQLSFLCIIRCMSFCLMTHTTGNPKHWPRHHHSSPNPLCNLYSSNPSPCQDLRTPSSPDLSLEINIPRRGTSEIGMRDQRGPTTLAGEHPADSEHAGDWLRSFVSRKPPLRIRKVLNSSRSCCSSCVWAARPASAYLRMEA